MQSKKLTRGLLAVYLLVLTWIIVFKMSVSFQDFPQLRSINFIPFAESVVTNGKLDFSEILNNLLAFVPFGIFMGMLLERKPFLYKMIPIFFTSLAFEAAQFLFSIGASDITDLLANTFGGGIGIGIFALLSKILKDNTQKILNMVCFMGDACFILLVGVLVAVNF